MRSHEQIEEERQSLLQEKQTIDQMLEDARNNRTLAGKRAIGGIKRRSQEIQTRLSALRVERRKLHDKTKPPTSTSPQARTAVLFQVAKAADDYLFGDLDDETAGDVLEAALRELDNIVPGWRSYKKETA